MERYVCVHGHFYQPPRENPWLEMVELQDSAYPYHDWNERITAECYGPNSASRILDGKDRIVKIVNNYGKISFDFGPTLLSWMKQNAPVVYEAVLEADRESQRRFSGHGSALAQAYNHMILPLANRQDKTTQILWGIKDFTGHFGREPEGMWLPETAVDVETLEILAEEGIRFTVLAAHQAHRVRLFGEKAWQDVSEGNVDPTMPYVQSLPSGRTIDLFFYDGPISRAVAFEKLLESGEAFARRLNNAFSDEHNRPQIVHIATDGESYGHHHRFGDMALAFALEYIETNNLAKLTNYGDYLERHGPTHEVQIHDNSSWSCAHGIERWRSNCGCNTASRPGWDQRWRKPLRDALDWLRDTINMGYEREARSVLKSPWEARDGYVDVIADRSPQAIENFIAKYGKGTLGEAEKIKLLKLLELQRHMMLMYTSCGWFFDELSGIETVQIIQYAARTIQLAQDVLGQSLEETFLKRLEGAKSNIAEHQNGRTIYEKFVKPAMVDLEKVGAHYAISSLFEDYEKPTSVACYQVDQEVYEDAEAGKAKLAVGRIKITSEITLECDRFCFGVLHWGNHSVSGKICPCSHSEPGWEVVSSLLEIFALADFPEVLTQIERYFEGTSYSLNNIFRDEQRKILEIILESTLDDIEGVYRQVYENNVPLLRFLKDLRIPRPQALAAAADFVFNVSLQRSFQEEQLDPDAIRDLIVAGGLEGVSFDPTSLEIVVRTKLERLSGRFAERPDDFKRLQELDAAAGLLGLLPFEVNTRNVQNQYYEVLREVYPELHKKEKLGNKKAKQWTLLFRELGSKLWVRVD